MISANIELNFRSDGVTVIWSLHTTFHRNMNRDPFLFRRSHILLLLLRTSFVAVCLHMKGENRSIGRFRQVIPRLFFVLQPWISCVIASTMYDMCAFSNTFLSLHDILVPLFGPLGEGRWP